ncbi:hypothetical protein PIB19_14095 [Sphingomonas sp. 7/4-4]|uniref:hypothetical protein n=1 Tax=Sphingomonas sp. 7/4-4 TaxID=3018446 RepID=UPI0022F40113|nr:hypothetical protein [Sphingomonas sp. 7/4-4]WBY06672.1 hypothetical protein PIB19_14095 [Sphingomonas sp. 7/4-4]
MPDSNEIIVIAKPDVVTIGNQTNPTPGPSTDGGALQFAQRSQAKANASVTVEPAASDDEIVVVAQKFKQELIALYHTGAAIPILTGTHSIPCIGNVTGRELYSIINNLKFSITTQNFGEGRAGANYHGTTDGNSVPVSLNATAVKAYAGASLPNGISYLVAHEIAHTLNAMQTYNKQLWEAYVTGAGAGLTYEQQVAQYPNSDQFKENEARANTVGRAIQALMNRSASGFTPTYGYQVC